ncbi:hypothetical protein HK098_005246 [Nowakowskiella sp. JEL0407]|nr:hypothetical protein HK098_005246 [Nowakowskiella sp. JEL0407]
MMAYNESPLFLQLSPTSISKELPITIYESVVDPSGKMMFYTSTYKIETGEAERIAVDHVAKVSGGGKESQVTTQMNSQKNAIQMLHMRIKLLHKYLSDVKDGKIPKDYNILRAILALGNRFPSLDSAEFNDELLVEYTDVLLMQHLATVSKGIFAMSEVIYNIVSFLKIKYLNVTNP